MMMRWREYMGVCRFGSASINLKLPLFRYWVGWVPHENRTRDLAALDPYGYTAIMGRQPCCDKVGLKKGPWTAEEDQKLITFILNNGHCCWRAVPKLAGLLRCGKSCRLRWTNYLRPDLKRGVLSESEEQLIIQLHSHLGNRWSKIASHLPGRTDNEIKNYWNTHIKKKLKRMGIDPVTHKPITDQPQESKTLQAKDSNPHRKFNRRVDDNNKSNSNSNAVKEASIGSNESEITEDNSMVRIMEAAELDPLGYGFDSHKPQILENFPGTTASSGLDFMDGNAMLLGSPLLRVKDEESISDFAQDMIAAANTQDDTIGLMYNGYADNPCLQSFTVEMPVHHSGETPIISSAEMQWTNDMLVAGSILAPPETDTHLWQVHSHDAFPGWDGEILEHYDASVSSNCCFSNPLL